MEGEIKKGKFVSLHAMKAFNGNACIDPLIPNFGTRWRWVVNFTHRPLYPRERPTLPIQ
jgi:hypothetical protein